MDNSLFNLCNDLERATSRLGLITAHDALVLLCASLSAPKFQHILRASSCYDNEHLLKFNELLRTAISKILLENSRRLAHVDGGDRTYGTSA